MSRRPVAGHGTHACYRSGCRLPECTRAAVRADAERQLDRLAGRPRLVPTKVITRHVANLRDRGLRDADIIRAAGLEGYGLNTLLKRKKINRTTANKILSIPLDHKPAPLLVSSVGTVRRLRALYTLGHSGTQIANQLGITNAAVWRITNGQIAEVRTATDAAARALYARWSTVPGTCLRARNLAARNGWHGPLAWDDIDNPDEQPDTSVPANTLNAVALAAERSAEIRLLARAKTHPEVIAKRLGMTEDSVRKHLSRKHHTLYLELTA